MEIGYVAKSRNPKENASALSRFFFGWMIKIVKKGTTKGLELSDLFRPLDKDKSNKLTDRLQLEWEKEILRAEDKKTKPNLQRVLLNMFRFEIAMFGILWFILFVILKNSSPLIIAKLISLYANPYSEDKKIDFYATTAVLVGSVILTVFCMHHSHFGLGMIGMRMRIATSSLIYRKINRLSQRSLGKTASGQVVNLLSNDVSRFDQVMVLLHALWVTPIQILVLSYFIWQKVGVATLAGVLSMVIVSLPVQIYIGKIMGKLRLKISIKTDKRVKLMSEIISGIQVIKMYAWEKSFEKIVKLVRADEIKSIKTTSYLKGIFSSCLVFLERLSLFLTITCFILQGNTITAEIVFSLSQAFNILQLSIAGYFAWAVVAANETVISMKRLSEFLLMEEMEDSDIEEMKKRGIILLKVNASWTDSKKTLNDIILEIPPGTLCAVVGPVGGGKSSLLQLLLGELPRTSGRIQMGKQVSYCSQEPWIFQSTVQNNILFGQPFNKSLYEKTVKVCALERDFQQFPKGDKTIVGERGVSLSGGQRARINLARAIYRQTDIYLLDDPLSAVDTHVGKHLFEECINKHLKGKTRILVTHQLQYLRKANLIVVLNEGCIEAQGTFDELSNSKLDFTKLLAQSEEQLEDKEPEKVEFIPTPYYSNQMSSLSSRLSVISIEISQSDLNKFDDEEELLKQEGGFDPDSKPFNDYLKSTNYCLLIVVTLLLVLAQALCAGGDYWVAVWTDEEQLRHANNSIIYKTVPEIIIDTQNNSNGSFQSHTYKYMSTNTFSFDDLFDNIELDYKIYKVLKTDYAMLFYGVLVGGGIIFTLWRSILFFRTCMIASVNLHSQVFHCLLKAPMKFFNDNPSGRILNRISKDMGAIDETLPRELLDSIQTFLVMVGILVNVALSNYYAIIAMVVLGIIFVKMRTWFIASARILKHLEAITKSPIFSHINSTINGIVSIRASEASDMLIEEFDNHQDINTSAWYLLMACGTSFGLWLDLICVLFIACVSFSFVVLHSYSSVSGSMVGLALAQSMVLTAMLQFGMRQTAEVINQLTSVERVMEYTKIKTEGPFETPEGNMPKEPWPKHGLIDFERMCLKYVEDDPPVLKDLDFSIMPGQKIGIVGRTGAGKSSLIAALFRLAPYDGAIYIDGKNTKQIGLSDLRRRISIIPQEPVLFSATIRYNLDPFDEFNDQQLWNVLEQVDLKDSITSLDFLVAEGGGNFSLGQRQLICLARAALRNNKILVLDEATANVDPRTDLFIQTKLREKFVDCTVLTIAHRLNTIMDSDKILVMNCGKVVEFDHPHKLMQIPDGYFYKMVLETGPSMTKQLGDIAEAAYTEKNQFIDSPS